MSAGRVHMQASLILAGGFGVASLFSQTPSDVLYAVGAIAGILISPDLDVNNGNISDTIIKRRIGYFAQRAWNLLWHFYRRSLKHGGELSHFPVISTLGRVAYLYSFLIAFPHVLIAFALPVRWDLWYVLDWYSVQILLGYKLILGLMGSDFVHWGLDILTTEHKK